MDSPAPAKGGESFSPDINDQSKNSKMSGYLLKKSTAGEWQKRYFETNGSFLTYYKSHKMSKLLAALSLPQVGDIKLLSVDQVRVCLLACVCLSFVALMCSSASAYGLYYLSVCLLYNVCVCVIVHACVCAELPLYIVYQSICWSSLSPDVSLHAST